MDKLTKRLVDKANRASDKTRWGHYPMAPSVGLSEREIDRHSVALEAHATAAKACEAAGLPEEARVHRQAVEQHSWVTQRRGAF
jgi:hypothetical protein